MSKPEENKPLELSQEEQQIIADNRARKEKVTSVTKKVQDLLKKNNCDLRVNEYSPLNQLQIIVVSLD